MTVEESSASHTASYVVIGWVLITMFFWAFAFWHAPETTPEWLLRAQAACFGKTASGLPDSAGWTMLVLAPLSFLAALLVAMYQEIAIGLKYFSRSATGRWCFLLIAAVLLVEAGWVTKRIKQGITVANADFSPEEITHLPQNYPRTNTKASPFSLIDQSGQTVSLENLKGQVVLLTFAFAHCQTVCPVLVKNTQNAFRTLAPNSAKLLIITLDPWRDTPSSLPGIAKSWGSQEGELFLSGEVAAVEKVIKDYSMTTDRDQTTGEIVHPPLVFIIDKAGQIAYTFSNPSTTWIKQAAIKILE